MTYTNLPSPDSGRPWRIGVHRLGYEDGRFFLNRTSGRVVGPDGIPNKDAVLFNLRDGRVAMIHRVHPNMQLAVFDSLDDLWDPPAGYWDDHVRDLDRHTIIVPADGSLGVGAGAPPVLVGDDLVLFYHEREADGQYTVKVALLDHGTGRPSSILSEAVMRPQLPWERSGDVDDVVFVQGAVAAGGRHDLPDLRRGRPLRRSGDRRERRPRRRASRGSLTPQRRVSGHAAAVSRARWRRTAGRPAASSRSAARWKASVDSAPSLSFVVSAPRPSLHPPVAKS